MAILAAYTLSLCGPQSKAIALEDYLARVPFKGAKGLILKPTKAGSAGFAAYLESFKKALPAARASLSV